MQAIESDVSQADGRLGIKFYKYPEEDVVASHAEGRPIFREVDYIQISIPGDTLNERHRKVVEADKHKFPIQWARYKNSQESETHFEGTPLSEWTILNSAQKAELAALRFYTIEQVATASDQQITKLNMAAGMSPYAFRDKAIAFLKMASGAAEINKNEAEMARLKAEKEESDAKLAKLQAQMDNLMNMMEEKKPRGRKPKEETEATEE